MVMVGMVMVGVVMVTHPHLMVTPMPAMMAP